MASRQVSNSTATYISSRAAWKQLWDQLCKNSDTWSVPESFTPHQWHITVGEDKPHGNQCTDEKNNRYDYEQHLGERCTTQQTIQIRYTFPSEKNYLMAKLFTTFMCMDDTQCCIDKEDSFAFVIFVIWLLTLISILLLVNLNLHVNFIQVITSLVQWQCT